jgi:hypothetical protein
VLHWNGRVGYGTGRHTAGGVIGWWIRVAGGKGPRKGMHELLLLLLLIRRLPLLWLASYGGRVVAETDCLYILSGIRRGLANGREG